MKITILIFGAALATASCAQRNRSDAVDALHRDVVKLTQQIAEIRVELNGVRGSYDALVKENAILRERVRQIELNEFTRSSPPSVNATTPRSAPGSTATETLSGRRGGYTQLVETPRVPSTALPPPAAPAGTARGPVVLTIGDSTQTSSITTDQAIISRCSQEWKTDYSMIAYCQKKQQEAKSKLDRGNVYGINGLGFDTIRRGCLQEWGTDYSMRAYCEEKQATAYKQVNH